MKSINKSPLSAQQGFTLIELVVVIVILGILAATAAPKFIDLTGDARGATVQAVRAAVESANTMAHAKALVSGETDETGTIDINGSTTDGGSVAMVHGWPAPTAAAWDELLDVDTTSTNPPFNVAVNSAGDTIRWYPSSATATADCFVTYTESDASTTKPVIALNIDDC